MGQGLAGGAFVPVEQPAPPAKRQLALVRDRHWVVADVTSGALLDDELSGSPAGPQHLVTLVSVEDDGATDDLSVIWEVEPGATVPLSVRRYGP